MRDKQADLFYVYTHFRKDTNQIFYVGMARHARGNFARANALNKNGRNEIWYKMYMECDEDIKIKVTHTGLSKEAASEIEKQLIAKYGRFGIDENGILSNRFSGGYRTGQDPIKVAQYDRDGNYIKTWRSMRDAAKFYGVNFKAIWQSMKKPCLSCGCQWRFLKSDEHAIEKIEKYVNREIYQYDRAGNYVKSFISAKEAANSVGVDPSAIRHCILGDKPTSGGYKWSYYPPS